MGSLENLDAIRRIVEIANEQYPQLDIGSYKSTLRVEQDGTWVRTTNGKMFVSSRCMDNMTQASSDPDYALMVALSFERD
jgi:hypothetical protein